MKYAGSLVSKEREEIFKLFLDKFKLKFNEIEKAIKIRSNRLAYHINKMQKEGLIEKQNQYYLLTKDAEKYIPIFSNIIGKELGPTPIILVALINKDKILLIKRNRRPYKNYWSMIGGKMLLGENFKESSIRQIKEKTSIEGRYISINSTLHERVKDKGIIKHSFILFFTKILTNQLNFIETEHGKLKWFKLKNIEIQKIIPSDLWLIKNKLNSKIDAKSVFMYENKKRLSPLRFL